MATSQEFQKHLSNGDLGEAMKLALSEMIELRISTRVVSEDGSVDDRPGHQIQTRINIVDGDIENEIGSLFLKDGPYSELRSFHAQQVAEAQQIIRTNIESLQTLFSLFFQGQNRPSGQPQTTAVPEQFAQPLEEVDGSSLSDSNNVGFSDFGSPGMGVAAAAGSVAVGAAAVGVTAFGFGQFGESEPLESVAPMALTDEAQDPEAFTSLMDGEGDWDDDEGDYGPEPLAELVEPLPDEEDADADLSAPFGESSVEPLADLSFSSPSVDRAEPDLAGFEVMEAEDPGEFSLEDDSLTDVGAIEAEDAEEFNLEAMEPESSVDLNLDSGSESFEDSFDAALNETPELNWEGEETDESSLDTEEPDNVLSFDEVDVAEQVALPGLEADAEAFSEDSFDGVEDVGAEDVGAEISPLVTDTLDLEDSEAEPFSFEAVTEAEAAVEMAAIPEEDSFILPDFEEPMGDLDALDIPEDFPDPLADLAFTPHPQRFEPEEEPDVLAAEPFTLANEAEFPEDELPEDELTEDDMELDPAIWSLASDGSEASDIDEEEGETARTEVPETGMVPTFFREEELVTEHDLSPFVMPQTQASEAWNFETIEPAAESSDFSLEAPDALEEPEAIEDDFGASSFAELGELEPEPFSEAEPPVDDFLGAKSFDLVSDDEAMSAPDSFLEEDSFEMEEESLVAVDDFSSLDDLDSSPSDRDLEESFADDFAGEILDDLSSLSDPEEPQTFEEWEGLAKGMSLEETSANLEAVNMEATEELEELEPLNSFDDLDSGTWDDVATPGGSGASGLNDEWDDDADDFDDLDDMALSPEELGTTESLHLDQSEPLVGDAMGLADVDAMDSLFQNSDNDFDFESTSEAADLDPFLDLDDPFDDVQDSEEDPFAELDPDDSPLFPPPPPRPHR
ncbi:MAG: hypothetical protein RLZZ435_1091 [Cyanobacteriota bacterium]